MHNIQNLADVRRTIYDEHHAHPPFGSHARQEIALHNIDAILCEVIPNLIPTANDTLERVLQSESGILPHLSRFHQGTDLRSTE